MTQTDPMGGDSKYFTAATITLALAAAISASTALYIWKRKAKGLESKVQELQKSINSSLAKCNAERQGRIRAQQVLLLSSVVIFLRNNEN